MENGPFFDPFRDALQKTGADGTTTAHRSAPAIHSHPQNFVGDSATTWGVLWLGKRRKNTENPVPYNTTFNNIANSMVNNIVFFKVSITGDSISFKGTHLTARPSVSLKNGTCKYCKMKLNKEPSRSKNSLGSTGVGGVKQQKG